MRPPTLRQREALQWINVFMRAQGHAPTIREIGTALGISSTNAVMDLVRALERKGLLTRKPGRARTMRITPLGESILLMVA